MKPFKTTIALFIGIMLLAFVGTTFVLNKRAEAQGVTVVPGTSQTFIAQKITNDLRQLDTVKQNLNNSLFKSVVFQSLKDFSQPLPPEDAGRSNPFAPIGL